MIDEQYEFTDGNGFLWKDSTAYSQKAKRNPTSYELRLHFKRPINIRISVGHIDYRGEWIYLCYELGIKTPHLLRAETRESAANEALSDCREIVSDFVKMLKIL